MKKICESHEQAMTMLSEAAEMIVAAKEYLASPPERLDDEARFDGQKLW